MKPFLVLLSLAASLLAPPSANARTSDADTGEVRAVPQVAAHRATKPTTPADKAAPAAKPESRRKKPALPRHLFM